jgi:hypothetical protein
LDEFWERRLLRSLVCFVIRHHKLWLRRWIPTGLNRSNHRPPSSS